MAEWYISKKRAKRMFIESQVEADLTLVSEFRKLTPITANNSTKQFYLKNEIENLIQKSLDRHN